MSVPVNATVEGVVADANDDVKHRIGPPDWSVIWKASFSSRLWDMPQESDDALELWALS